MNVGDQKGIRYVRDLPIGIFFRSFSWFLHTRIGNSFEGCGVILKLLMDVPLAIPAAPPSLCI